MNEEKPSANIIQGPWKKGRKVVVPDPDETAKIQEDLFFADELTQQLLVQMIHTMSENSFNVGSESFIRSTAFIIECVKASIYKELDLDHPMNSLIDIVTKVTIDENDQLQGSVDPRVIYELSERIDNDPEPEFS